MASASALDLGDSAVDTRAVLARAQGDGGVAAAGRELGDDGEADLAGAAEEQDVLGLAYCIQHFVFLSFF